MRGIFQITALVFVTVSILACIRAWRVNLKARPHISHLLPWLVHSLVFQVVLVVRVCIYGLEPPILHGITSWASGLMLHGYVAVFLAACQDCVGWVKKWNGGKHFLSR